MSEVKTIVLENDKNPDVEFVGEQIAFSSSKTIDGARSQRWHELRLFKTEGGKYVCQQVGRTIWQGETDRFSVAVCDTDEEVKAFFGYSQEAKDLYYDANISATQRIA